jgi:hypothetical protein
MFEAFTIFTSIVPTAIQKMTYYILKNQIPVLIEDPITWSEWFFKETAARTIARNEKDDITVSTVFVGIEASLPGSEPKLFETMIFGNKSDDYVTRYSTWEEAKRGHQAICDAVFGDLP